MQPCSVQRMWEAAVEDEVERLVEEELLRQTLKQSFSDGKEKEHCVVLTKQ